ncbi:hypothetical protein OSTOST_18560, partial [Ostertagia ostertagi]
MNVTNTGMESDEEFIRIIKALLLLLPDFVMISVPRFMIFLGRFVALMFPFRYWSIEFTPRTTYGIVAIVATIYAVYASAFLMDGCDFSYSHVLTKWEYGAQPCAQHLLRYMDFYYDSSLVVAFTLIELLLIARLMWTKK